MTFYQTQPSGVNFINIFFREFCAKKLQSLNLNVSREKLRQALLCKKFARKMLMKLTPGWHSFSSFSVLQGYFVYLLPLGQIWRNCGHSHVNHWPCPSAQFQFKNLPSISIFRLKSIDTSTTEVFASSLHLFFNIRKKLFEGFFNFIRVRDVEKLISKILKVCLCYFWVLLQN